MSEYPLTLEGVVSWLRSKKDVLEKSGVTLAEVRERSVHVPAASADFDAVYTIGRINAWVSGEIDFEVLRRSDGQDIFVQHESVLSLHQPSLESTFSDFLRSMTRADMSENAEAG